MSNKCVLPKSKDWTRPGFKPSDLGFDAARFPGFRSQQLEIVRNFFASEKTVLIVQAPPGVGKTLVAACIARIQGGQTIYVVTTKQLQDQALADFEVVNGGRWAVTLKGRNNYSTLLYQDQYPQVSCELCTRTRYNPHCKLCCDGSDGLGVTCITGDICPYQTAKRETEASPFPILNTSMFLNLSEFAGIFIGNETIIFDEADMLESEVMSFIELRISPTWADWLRLTLPDKNAGQSTWIRWLREAVLPTAKELREALEKRSSSEWELLDIRIIRHAKWTERIISQVERFLEAVNAESWVFLPEEMVFKPVHVARFAEKLLWSKARRKVLMSATVISAEMMCRDLGIPLADMEFVDLASDFPPRRRPVYIQPVASVTHKTSDFALPKIVKELDRILDRHADDKVLVHTVSYVIRKYIVDHSRHQDRLISYVSASERGETLERFKRSGHPLALVAPSMERGVDLPADLCRAVVICKVPYPNLGDKQVAARAYTKPHGGAWYAIQTIRSLVQMTGRGMRRVDDYALSYILDSQFSKLWYKWKHLFPSWWKEAVIWNIDRKN